MAAALAIAIHPNSSLEFTCRRRHAIGMSVKHIYVLLLTPLLSITNAVAGADEYTLQRQQMISEIEGDVEITAKYLNKKSFDASVIQAIKAVPRHEFVPPDLRAEAYENRPLPIGHGQTISQPYIVALMTDMLQPEPGQTVLEVGTGSGYQAAVLSQLVAQVYSIEIIEPLAQATTRLLKQLGYNNIETRIADGYDGWPQHAPFDSIVVTAAISHIPPPLVKQLKNGGRMVIPVGTRFQTQYLTLVEKDMQGKVTTRQLLPVYFVPFTGGH
jgi:protein-L-isoaspartate(D-aspartate) O-methyltransferase